MDTALVARFWLPYGRLCALGTAQENNRDKAAKGRCRSWRQRLTLAQARAIRREYAAGGVSHREIAIRYGVSKPTIPALLRGDTWKEAA